MNVMFIPWENVQLHDSFPYEGNCFHWQMGLCHTKIAVYKLHVR